MSDSGDDYGESVPTDHLHRPHGASDEPAPLSVQVAGEGIFRTHRLPKSGQVVIGRSASSSVCIDAPSISRRHAVLHLGATVEIEDLGSANGTQVRGRRLPPGERATLEVGEAIDLGSVMLVLQRESSTSRPRRLWSHGYFEGRLEEECARAQRTGGPFSVVRVDVGGIDPGEAHGAMASVLRSSDMMAAYGPDQYELLITEARPAEAERTARLVAARMVEHGARVSTGVASFPLDGRTPEALLAHACTAVRGGVGESASDIVVCDPAMVRLQALIERIAGGNISVLVLGETGVGKEIVAETIHRRSPRAAGPYLRLNCGAFSETLLESELFGYEKGAFTGATQAKPGLIETADRGTVLLDEIGELPRGLQVKLLRVLEDRQVLRVGGLKARTADVRFVAATNRDLEREVAAGNFRQDLYFRLGGVSLFIPPLRERRSEIAPLARAFAAAAAERRGAPPPIADLAMALLERYGWPGNIRELRNVIERAVLLSGGGPILPEHLPVEKMSAPLAPARHAPAPEPHASELEHKRREIDELERHRVLDALARCSGNQTQAARLLGVSRNTLLSRLERYQVPRPRRR